MRILNILLLLLMPVAINAQDASAWSGRFDGTIIGINATITAEAIGPSWYGAINASGYPLQLEGIITDNRCAGTMTDPQTESAVSFNATLDGSKLTIMIRDINPTTGLEEDMEFAFVKTEAASGTYSQSASVTVLADNIDGALVGKWRYTDTYVSGTFSIATDYFMQLNGDGVAYATDGRSAGGDHNSSIVSGEPDVHQSTWKTENNILYFNDGINGWQSYAQYYVEPSRMMLTFHNGRKQVWERI